jgi:hypothetical protein
LKTLVPGIEDRTSKWYGAPWDLAKGKSGWEMMYYFSYDRRHDKASISTTHDGETESQDTTELYDVYLVVCALVRKGPGSRSKVWDPGTWIQCVPHCPVVI